MTISFPLPNDVNLLVKVDDMVDFNTPLYEKRVNKEIEINVARTLGINPKNIFRYLTKLVGETINKNDVIALKKGLFFSNKVRSPVVGVIKEINHNQGLLVVDTYDKKSKAVLSPFKGEVERITKNEIDFKLTKVQEYPIKKAVSDFGGEIYYLKSDKPPDILISDIENKIVFAEKISAFTEIKAEALGAKGFVTVQELPQETDIGSVQIKNIDDGKKIEKNKFRYCSIVAKSAKIYFYS